MSAGSAYPAKPAGTKHWWSDTHGVALHQCSVSCVLLHERRFCDAEKRGHVEKRTFSRYTYDNVQIWRLLTVCVLYAMGCF